MVFKKGNPGCSCCTSCNIYSSNWGRAFEDEWDIVGDEDDWDFTEWEPAVCPGGAAHSHHNINFNAQGSFANVIDFEGNNEAGYTYRWKFGALEDGSDGNYVTYDVDSPEYWYEENDTTFYKYRWDISINGYTVHTTTVARDTERWILTTCCWHEQDEETLVITAQISPAEQNYTENGWIRVGTCDLPDTDHRLHGFSLEGNDNECTTIHSYALYGRDEDKCEECPRDCINCHQDSHTDMFALTIAGVHFDNPVCGCKNRTWYYGRGPWMDTMPINRHGCEFFLYPIPAICDPPPFTFRIEHDGGHYWLRARAEDVVMFQKNLGDSKPNCSSCFSGTLSYCAPPGEYPCIWRNATLQIESVSSLPTESPQYSIICGCTTNFKHIKVDISGLPCAALNGTFTLDAVIWGTGCTTPMMFEYEFPDPLNCEQQQWNFVTGWRVTLEYNITANDIYHVVCLLQSLPNGGSDFGNWMVDAGEWPVSCQSNLLQKHIEIGDLDYHVRVYGASS